MTKYKVELSYSTVMFTVVEIEAESEDAATDLARERDDLVWEDSDNIQTHPAEVTELDSDGNPTGTTNTY
jgi:hypothetical protein